MSNKHTHGSKHDSHGQHQQSHDKSNAPKEVVVKGPVEVQEISPMNKMKEELERRRDLKDGHTYLSELVREVFSGNKAVMSDIIMLMCDVIEQGSLTVKERQSLEMVVGQAAHKPQLWEVVEALIKVDKKAGVKTPFFDRVKEQVKNVLEHPTEYSASKLQVAHMVDRHPELR